MRNPIVFLTLALIPLTAVAQTTRPSGTLVVSGHGQVFVTPDHATVTFGVVGQADEAATAQNEINEKMQAVVDAVKKLGIDDKNIQTSTLSLQPMTRMREVKKTGSVERQTYIAGYEASNSIRVRLDDLTKIGPLIDAGVKAGANTIDGVQFVLKDDTDASNAALQAACEQAKSKAEALAKSMGVALGGIDQISEAGAEPPTPRPMMATAFARAAAPTPIQSGQVQLDASVTVRYRVSTEK